MPFPDERPRRLRRNERLRALVRETRVTPDRLIYPLFVTTGRGVRREISSLPGCFHLSPDEAARVAREVEKLGIAGVILFGLPEGKDATGSQGWSEDGVVPRAVRAIRDECKELLVATDVCLCEYTSHGHCGVVEGGDVKNDATLERDISRLNPAISSLPARRPESDSSSAATSCAAAWTGWKTSASGSRGSASRAGRCSSGRGPGPIGRRPPGPRARSRRRRSRNPARGRAWSPPPRPSPARPVPGAGNRHLKAAAQRGWIEEERVVKETLTSIARAGADIILTYHAKDFARWR